LYLSYIFWAVVLILLLIYSQTAGIFTAFILYGLHKGALDPVQKTLVAELASKEYIASTIGAFQMITGLISLPASFLAGVMWDTFTPLTPLYFSLILTLISAGMLVFVKESE